MLIDDTVIARQSAEAGALYVVAQRHEVLWTADGSSVQLHPVYCRERPVIMLRAVEMPGGHMLQVDLQRLVRSLGADLLAAAARDQVGLTFYTLRREFQGADAFRAACERSAQGTWWPAASGYVWQAAARQAHAQVPPSARAAVVVRTTSSQWCPQ